MVRLRGLNKRDIIHWAIFLAYAFMVAFYLLTFSHTVDQEITLSSLSIEI